jgi:hypothetical protein
LLQYLPLKGLFCNKNTSAISFQEAGFMQLFSFYGFKIRDSKGWPLGGSLFESFIAKLFWCYSGLFSREGNSTVAKGTRCKRASPLESSQCFWHYLVVCRPGSHKHV